MRSIIFLLLLCGTARAADYKLKLPENVDTSTWVYIHTLDAQSREQRSNPYRPSSLVLPEGAYTIQNGDTLTVIVPSAHGGSGDTIPSLYFSTFSIPTVWTVMKGTEAVTLDEFVRSGRWCAIYGHQEEDTHYGLTFLAYCPNGCNYPTVYKCKICGATRTVSRETHDSGWTKP